MNIRSGFIKIQVVLLFLLMLLLLPQVTSAQEGGNPIDPCSGWEDPQFLLKKNNVYDMQFSPTSYYHCHWDSNNYDGSEYFVSRLRFNAERADEVRVWSNTDFDVTYNPYKCRNNCWAYYTHDHSDGENCRLSVRAVYSDMPNPKYDMSGYDDGMWCKVETFYGDDWVWVQIEAEVAVRDHYFPNTNQAYKFESWWERKLAGYGDIEETPAVSIRAEWGDYNTFFYDDHPQFLDYKSDSGFTPATRRKDSNTIKVTAQHPNIVTTETQQINGNNITSLKITSWENLPAIQVEISDFSVGDERRSKNRDSYIEWSKTIPQSISSMASSRRKSMSKALTVITFNQPVLLNEIDDLASTLVVSDVVRIKAIFTDPQTKVDSTFDTRVIDENYNQLLDNVKQSKNAELKGIVSITAWLNLDTVNRLNSNSSVYLADASPTYLRLMANNSPEFQSIQDSATIENVNMTEAGLGNIQDGANQFIVPEYSDLYGEWELNNNSPEEHPTVVSVQQTHTSTPFVTINTIIYIYLLLILIVSVKVKAIQNK